MITGLQMILLFIGLSMMIIGFSLYLTDKKDK